MGSIQANQGGIGQMLHWPRGPDNRISVLPGTRDRRTSSKVIQHAGGRGEADATHWKHERICGEVVDMSGNRRGMDLTGIVRMLEPILRYQAKAPLTWGKG